MLGQQVLVQAFLRQLFTSLEQPQAGQLWVSSDLNYLHYFQNSHDSKLLNSHLDYYEINFDWNELTMAGHLPLVIYQEMSHFASIDLPILFISAV